MKELQMLIEAFEQVEHTAALATIVKVSGSTYRRPGARMLMTSNAQMVGSISGGCLEADVFEHALQVMRTGEPLVIKYDTTSQADIVLGLGLGCNGVVHILIERLTKDRQPNSITFLADCLQERQTGVLVTVSGVVGQAPEKVGARLMLQPNGNVMMNCIKDFHLAAAILEDSHTALRYSQSTVKSYQLPTGEVEVLIEAIQPPVPLKILGAGHEAIPLVSFAKELGWHVTVVDSRQTYATPDQFPLADAVVCSHPESLCSRVTIDHRTVAVIMTHNYLQDLEFVKVLLPSPVRYLGILGPKNRAQRLLQDLGTEGMVYTQTQLQRLFAPVGLDIGADTPEAIALAIVAEIQAVLANRCGGLLKDRKGPIHDRSKGYQSEDLLCLPSVS